MTAENPYASLDEPLAKWCEQNGYSLLLRDAGNQNRRFFYVSPKDGECFSVTIDPVGHASFIVRTWDIETTRDCELQADWMCDSTEVVQALEEAVAKI